MYWDYRNYYPVKKERNCRKSEQCVFAGGRSQSTLVAGVLTMHCGAINMLNSPLVEVCCAEQSGRRFNHLTEGRVQNEMCLSRPGFHLQLNGSPVSTVGASPERWPVVGLSF